MRHTPLIPSFSVVERTACSFDQRRVVELVTKKDYIIPTSAFLKLFDHGLLGSPSPISLREFDIKKSIDIGVDGLRFTAGDPPDLRILDRYIRDIVDVCDRLCTSLAVEFGESQ